MIRALTGAAFFFIGVSAYAQHGAADKLKQGQPRDVQRLVDRIIGCNHFAGEEPYDEERSREIANATRRLRCSTLSDEEAIARQRHANHPAALRALTAARALGY